MKMLKRILLIAVIPLTMTVSLLAHVPKLEGEKVGNKSSNASLREDCAPSRSSADLDVNNVRTKLLGGGDVWWDLRNGRYIVPKVDPASGLTEVSSLFAGSVWLGGFGPGGNLKVAAQTYRQSGNDFWPGPLIEKTGGTTEKTICEQWDRHFIVYGRDIDRHIQNWTINQDPVTKRLDDITTIPEAVLYWPAFGNPYFEQRFGFALPNNFNAGLADFWDEDLSLDYDPAAGDYPRIGIKGCEDDPRYPDQMVFWIYNDAGNVHTQTNSPEFLRMEVQVQAFAYATNDEINDMTFYRYKLINRGLQLLDSTIFTKWVDADLGCHLDDYIGCDTTFEGTKRDGNIKHRDLMYVYNEDATDGQNGCNCPGGVPTYCNNIPILGVDYFRGPLDLDSIIGYDNNGLPINLELGMSSFTYYNNNSSGNWPAPMTDPNTYIEYYRYMTGSWRDGTRFTTGGTGYSPGGAGEINNYVFSDPPRSANGWSMCTANLDYGDRRTLQSSGPFQLKPGAINELIVGIVWVPNETYPCPSLDRLLYADGLAQALFDNCFDITDGPDAPDITWVELNQEVIAVLTNERDNSFRLNNNSFELYEGLDLRAPTTIPEEERKYRFEGYKIYQLKDANVSLSELNNIERAQLVYQVDLQNGVSKIYNWRENRFDGISEVVWLPVLMVDGADQGIRHTFKMTEDLFSLSSDRRLINHRDYYYTVVSYAHNSFGEFVPSMPLDGQRTPYLEGRRNVKVYKVTPRPITDIFFNAAFGDGFVMKRLDGKGAGQNFLDLLPDQYDKILTPGFDGQLLYQAGRGPVQVKVYNPFNVKDGTYRLFTEDPDNAPQVLSNSATWRLEYTDSQGNQSIHRPDFGLARFNEQVFGEFGIAISIVQSPNAGNTKDGKNGFIGAELVYADPFGPKWYNALKEADVDFIPTQDINNTEFYPKDPKQAFSKVAENTWYPYTLCDYKAPPPGGTYTLVTPGWVNATNNQVVGGTFNTLDSLNNVDIVFTSDRSKWSRCVVVETSTDIFNNFQDPQLPTPVRQGSQPQFRIRQHNSLELNPDANGLPVYQSDTLGLGWFPGYAVDVETGERLNIFYGENSVFYPDVMTDLLSDPIIPGKIGANGRDMIWNPSTERIVDFATTFGFDVSLPAYPLANVFGGHHTIYVTRDKYDGCFNYWDRLRKPGVPGTPTPVLRRVTWTSMPVLSENTVLRSFKDGIIPNDLIVKLRVDKSYAKANVTGINNSLPAYEWTIEGREAEVVAQNDYPELLAAIDVVPNPYYGLSYYENNEFATTVKITNLPARAIVNIYTLDGKFIRRFDRNETPGTFDDKYNIGVPTSQIIPNLDWDLKNTKGIPVSSGIYLIHVEVPGVGTRTLKWFGIQRQFDPSKL